MEKIDLYIPKLNELWFRQEMLSDPSTMSYNANYDEFEGYNKDTGCIDFPKTKWADWYGFWVDNEPKRFYAYIRRTADGVFVGEINFHFTPEEDRWDMGIVIYAPYRGNGYAVPALRLMLEHAFKDCGVTKLHNYFETTRYAAVKAHLAVGFRDAGVVNGIRHFIITREEYLGKN